MFLSFSSFLNSSAEALALLRGRAWWLAAAFSLLLLTLMASTAVQASDVIGGGTATPPASGTPGSTGLGSGIKTICPNPNTCFKTKEAKDAWAAKNNCQFLEDVCEKTPPSKDNQGASNADAGFWESFFTSVKNALVYGYEFTKGLMSGLKEQVTDIISLVTNIGDVIDGLVNLGKAFYDDPKGTMAAMAEMLGQDAIDTITKATQCGAYDLGKVIGQNINPAVMVKLAAKLGKFSGKVVEAVKDTKKDVGCASFTAGTWIHTRNSLVAIQTLRRNDWVHSRDETHWLDAPQRITSTFGRVAPSYRELQTEFETFQLTDEHPLWVQGKGWTEARAVEEGDVLAALKGDMVVLRNTLRAGSTPVYNFSVANTPNYFVGESGLWAHNAKKVCDITRTSAFDGVPIGTLTKAQRGFVGELKVSEFMDKNGFDRLQGVDYENDLGQYDKYKGSTGIDGIYKKGDKYYIVESKTTGAELPGKDLCGTTDKLCTLKGGERQMSNKWISERLDGLKDEDKKAIEKALKDGALTRVYAKTYEDGTTTYNTIVSKGANNILDATAEIGGVWSP